MKTLTTILLLTIALNINSQQEANRICFPREKQAEKQTDRLNISHRKLLLNKETGKYDYVFKSYEECEIQDLKGTEKYRTTIRYCIDIDTLDLNLKYGTYNNIRVIKKRHQKYLVEAKSTGMGITTVKLAHKPSKFQNFIIKTFK